MRFKYVCRKLHKWLGWTSGTVVFVICITGCLYVFKDEIEDLSQPWRFVTPQDSPYMLPSQILEGADRESGKRQPYAITYGEPQDALTVDYLMEDLGALTFYLNPYTGRVIKSIRKHPGDFDFFRFVLDGHKRLWLPSRIGKQLVGWSVLAFVIILITGLVLWYPRHWNKKSCKRLLLIRWKLGAKRLNFDLHNVTGGYFALLLLLLSFTGLIWNMNWFSKSVYRLTGGKELKPYVLPQSGNTPADSVATFPLDRLFIRLKQEEPEAKEFYIVIPQKPEDVCRVSIVHKRGSYYHTDNRFFDRFTLKELSGQGPYAGKYREASVPDKIRRMNLELHDGRIAGLPGKIVVFLAALAGASLFITGLIMKFKKQKRRRKLLQKRV